MDEYIKLLQSHDWFYNYSDDHRVWKAGEASYNKIVALARIHDPKFIIYTQYMKV